MPAVRAATLAQRGRVLHERNALALDRAGDQHLRPVAHVAERGEGGTELLDVVAVAGLDMPAERAEPLLEGAEGDDLVRRLVGLELVPVYDDRQPGEALVRGRLQPLVVLPLLQLAVADHDDHPAASPEVPLRPGDPAPLRDPHPERPGVRLDARDAHVRVPVEAAESAQLQEPLAGDHAEAVEGRVQPGHVVPLRREVDIAVGIVPADVGGVQLLEEQERNDVHRAEGRAEMPRSRPLDRDERVQPAHVRDKCQAVVCRHLCCPDTIELGFRDEGEVGHAPEATGGDAESRRRRGRPRLAARRSSRTGRAPRSSRDGSR